MHRTTKLRMSCFTLFSVFMLTVNSVEAQNLEPVRGVVKPGHEAVLSADMNARVLGVPVVIGEEFAKDDVLLQFDCQIHKAEARAASAAYVATRTAHESNIELQQYGAAGELEVKVSKAEMQKAYAQSEAITARTNDCVILAPFDGKVAELTINEFETPAPNQPLMKIVSSDEYEVQLIVPSLWLSWIRPGSTFEFVVDETGNRHQATVLRLGAEVDAVSRTVPVIGGFTEVPEVMLPGMSGTANFMGPDN